MAPDSPPLILSLCKGERSIWLEHVRQAMKNPAAFFERLITSVGPAAKKLLIAKVRSKLEPVVEKQGLEWCDVEPALELVDSMEELEAAIADPEAFLQSLAQSMGPAAKKIALAKLRPRLEPLLEKQGLEWADVAPALEEVRSGAEAMLVLASGAPTFESLV